MRSLIPPLRRPAPEPQPDPQAHRQPERLVDRKRDQAPGPASPAPALPEWRLPPGAALWRATTQPARRAPAEAPVPVWRSDRLQRRMDARSQGAPPPPAEERPAPPPQAAPELPRVAPASARPVPDRAPDPAPAPAPDPLARLPGVDPAVAPAPRPQRDPPASQRPETHEPVPPRPRWRAAPAPPRPRDPAPSRMSYRLHRLWLTPLVRSTVRVGLPAWLLVMAVGLIASDDARRAWVVAQWQQFRDGLETRPEFLVTGLTIDGASSEVAAALRALGPQEWPVSSFRLELDTLRLTFEALDAVARADLRVSPEGVLQVAITERRPAAVWHDGEALALIDRDGYRVARLTTRAGRPDLPLLGGPGAQRAVPEALALAAAARPLGSDLVGLVRVGERRWDVVLIGERRLMLPETGALAALERVLAMDQADDLLARDVTHVDMRLPDRPTIRLSGPAMEELRRARATVSGGPTR